MNQQIEKIRKHAEYAQAIRSRENALPNLERSLREEYTGKYAAVQKDIRIYLQKISPTLETLCRLYWDMLQLKDGRLFLQGNTPQLAISGWEDLEKVPLLAKESIRYLSAVLQHSDTQANMAAFVRCYNTLAELACDADRLVHQAVASAVKKHQEEIADLRTKQALLFPDNAQLQDAALTLAHMDALLRKKLLIDRNTRITETFSQEICLPLGSEALLCQVGDAPLLLSLLEWELQKDGLMVIRTGKAHLPDAALSEMTVCTILHFLFSYPAMHKRLLLCDSSSNNAITTFAGILKKENPELFFASSDGSYVKNTDDEIRTSLSELSKLINQRIMLIGQSSCKNILEYNAKNPDNPLPIIMTLLNGFPVKYGNVAEDMESTLKNGAAAGVFFLITENTDSDEERKYYLRQFPSLESLTSNIVDYQTTDGAACLRHNGKTYIPGHLKTPEELYHILNTFRASTSGAADKVVLLDSVTGDVAFSDSKRRLQYAKTLDIPFGKQGATPVSVALNASDDAHLAVIGTTGSGKTAFINTLVLSACKLYAPTELELHLIVMVKGDFKIFEEQGLPHLKTVVTGDRIYAANDVLDFIDEELKRRGELIGSYGNIYAYNAVAKEPLPRCMIVIDEFYQLVQGSDEAIERINRIAQAGRAYGISLVISSISFPMDVSSLIPLFRNRIEFRSGENAGQLIPQAATRQNELEGIKGACFFWQSGNTHTVRVAYSEEGEQLKAHIQQIKEQYPGQSMVLRSRIEAFPVKREQDAPFAGRQTQQQYDEEGILRTRLGRTYLSGKPLEYPFDSGNNLLLLYGHYLDTKELEAALMKDTFVLSGDGEQPVVYYIDYNKNASLRRAKTVVRRLRDHWVQSGKMVYSGSNEAETTIEDIRQLIENREEDEESDLSPVLVVIAKADELFADDDLCELLCDTITKGKENNVYFAIQCNEPVRFYGSDRFVRNAILFPDRGGEDPDTYSSSALCAALESMPAGATEKGRRLCANATASPLDPKLHILCNHNKLTLFVPYAYDEAYLKEAVD